MWKKGHVTPSLNLGNPLKFSKEHISVLLLHTIIPITQIISYAESFSRMPFTDENSDHTIEFLYYAIQENQLCNFYARISLLCHT